jgi:hypothetical protein
VKAFLFFDFFGFLGLRSDTEREGIRDALKRGLEEFLVERGRLRVSW